MLRLLMRHWFLVMLAVMLGLGLTVPTTLAPVTQSFPRDGVLSATMFFMALPLEVALIWHAVRRPQAVMLGVAINSGLLPLTAWLVSLALRPDLAAGLLVAGSVPSTLASAAVWTRRARGNDAIAALVTLITNFGCFLITPFWLWLTTGTRSEISGTQMALELILVVVVPMLFGQLARLYRPLAAWATRHKPGLSLVAQWGILTMVLIAAVEAGLKLKRGETSIDAWSWLSMIASVMVVHVAMLVAGHALSALFRLSRADRIAVGFAGSQKTLMIGVNTALESFGGLAMFPMVAYHVCQLLIDALVAEWLVDQAVPPANVAAGQSASQAAKPEQLNALAAVDDREGDAS